MRRQIQTRCAFGVLLALLFTTVQGKAQFPTQKPTGYVNDLAGVLSPAARQQLEALCAELDQKAKAQLAIVTVRSLQGRPLEEFTVDLATKWGIGPKGSDRGVMLFLAIQDRRNRIEVGYGLEPIIPDGRAGSILRDMTPYLRNGDYDGAMRLGASTIAQIIAQDAGVTLAAPIVPRPPLTIVRSPEIPPVDWLELALVLLAATLPIGFVYWWLAAFDLSTTKKLWIASGLVFLGSILLLNAMNFDPEFLAGIVGAMLLSMMFGSEILLIILIFVGLARWDSGGGGGWFGGGGGGFGGFGGGGFGGGGASGSW